MGNEIINSLLYKLDLISEEEYKARLETSNNKLYEKLTYYCGERLYNYGKCKTEKEYLQDLFYSNLEKWSYKKSKLLLKYMKNKTKLLNFNKFNNIYDVKTSVNQFYNNHWRSDEFNIDIYIYKNNQIYFHINSANLKENQIQHIFNNIKKISCVGCRKNTEEK